MEGLSFWLISTTKSNTSLFWTVTLSLIQDYQLCILLYLQRIGFKSVKIGELLQELKVEDELTFNASIMMLLKAKVINKQGNPSKIESKN